MRNFILKHSELQKLQPFLKKVLIVISFAMLSSNLYAQRYRPENDDVTPTPWWLRDLILITILGYLWIKKKVKLKWYLYLLLSIVIIVAYTLIFMYKWVFYALLAMTALGLVIYVNCSDKIDKIINKLKTNKHDNNSNV